LLQAGATVSAGEAEIVPAASRLRHPWMPLRRHLGCDFSKSSRSPVMSSRGLAGPGLLLPCRQRPRTIRRPRLQGRRFLFQRSHTGGTPPLAVRAVALLLLICVFMTGAAGATAAKPTVAPLGGFIKDPALARVLGETLFRDTVEVMSDSSVP